MHHELYTERERVSILKDAERFKIPIYAHLLAKGQPLLSVCCRKPKNVVLIVVIGTRIWILDVLEIERLVDLSDNCKTLQCHGQCRQLSNSKVGVLNVKKGDLQYSVCELKMPYGSMSRISDYCRTTVRSTQWSIYLVLSCTPYSVLHTTIVGCYATYFTTI
jgi:hypothetical protein